MTVAANYRDDYLGTGATADYDFTFEITAKSELSVRQRDIATGIETTLVLDSDFTIPDADVNNADGGTITLADGVLAAGQRLSLRRVLPLTQETDLRNQGAYQAEDVEDAFDRGIKIAQQHQDEIDRSLKLPESELPAATVVIPAVEERASKYLAFDADGNPIASDGTSGVPASAFGATLVDDADAATARETLGGLTNVVATVAALKALATTSLAGTCLVLGYAAAGDGGGGLFRWNTGDATADDGGTVLQLTAGGTGRWLRIDQGWLNAMWFGCTMDGSTNDAAAFTLAVTAASAAKRELYIPPGTLRLRSQVLLPSYLTLCGPGRILLDPAAYLSKALRALGSEGSEINLTVNVVAGDKTVTMASTTGLAVGDMVLVRANTLSNKWPQEANEIESLTATTVTFRTCLVAPYATADTARIVKITPKTDLVLRGLWIDCGTASDIGYLVSLEYVRNVRIEGCKFTGHRTTTSADSQGGILINSALDARVSNCQGQAVSGNGNFIGFVFGSQFSAVENQTYGYAFGIGVFFASQIELIGNSVRGIRAAGNRGLKVSGCYGVSITGNNVSCFDSGIKNEDSRGVNIVGNTVEQCGVGFTASAINVSNQQATTNEAATHIVNGNIVRGCTGAGILIDSGSYHADCIGNIVEDVQGRGIIANAQQLVVTGNEIRDWGKAYVGASDHLYAGIYVDRAASVTGNRFHNTLTTVPSIALSANATNSTIEVLANNASPTNDILWIGAANAGQMNGITIANNGAVVIDPQRLWVGSVGGCAKAKNVANDTKFSVTAFAEGMTISVGLGSGKAALFFADYNSATVVKLADPDSQFDVVLDSANRFNVYKSAGSSVINFQNKSGSLVSVLVSFIGTRIAAITDPA